jgi:S-layer family protein
MKRQVRLKANLFILAMLMMIVLGSTRLKAETGTCGGASTTLPFTDVSASNIFFCAIAEAYFSGLTNGTSATTYNPGDAVTREQMAAFITRTQDSALRRGSLRAALDQWAPPSFAAGAQTTVGAGATLVKSDGADLWVANGIDDTVSRVRASDGKLLETWTAAVEATAVLVARGRIFVTGAVNPGKLYRFDPRQPAGDVTVVTTTIGGTPTGIAYDGDFIWTSNSGPSVSRIDPGNGDVTNFSTGIFTWGILYDGSNIWVTDPGAGTLLKLNSNGTVAQTVPLGNVGSRHPIFDGTNIWVPNEIANTVSVVRVKDSQGNPLPAAFVLKTLTGNGLQHPNAAAFDGQRILVTNVTGDSVSLWKAADLTPLGSIDAGANAAPAGACSDGINFWVTLQGTNKLARL